jgi:sugar phosphate isomerase/epimerase
MRLGCNINCLKLGYMPDFHANLLSEVEFAKKHFDFVEITLKMELSEYTEDFIKQLKKSLGDLEVLGHLHWEINISHEAILPSKKLVFDMIDIYEQLGAKKMTIHPSSDDGYVLEEAKKNNLRHLLEISDYCREKGIILMVENNAHEPFSRASVMNEVVSMVPDKAITLDIGHANQFGELENFLKLKDMIHHVHLHDNFGKRDHLEFKDNARLNKVLDSLKSINYSESITLEMFFSLEGDKYACLNPEERPQLLTSQAKLIRELLG